MPRTLQKLAKGVFLLSLLGVVFGCGAIIAKNDIPASDTPNQAIERPAAPRIRKAVSTTSKRLRTSLVAQAAANTPTIRPVLDQSDITLNHRRIAEEVLRRMPSKCDGTLEKFFVRYDNPAQRGLAGKSTIILTGNVSDDEFRALLAHEYGHVMDLGCLQGTSRSGASAFRDGGDLIYNDDASVSF